MKTAHCANCGQTINYIYPDADSVGVDSWPKRWEHEDGVRACMANLRKLHYRTHNRIPVPYRDLYTLVADPEYPQARLI